MKYTLLDFVQTILSELDGDEINSINDNAEAMQIARIVRTTYFDVISRGKPPENFTLFSLEASGTADKPTLMTRPESANTVEWVKYNRIADDETAANFKYVTFKPINEFLDIVDSLNTDDDNVASFEHIVGTSTLSFTYRDDKAPDYYTTFDDYTIIFDSYDSEVDSTLQKVKTRCYGLVGETFSLSDTFQPPLDDLQHNLLLNQATSRSFESFKQMQHRSSEQAAKRGWVSLQKDKQGVKGWSDYYHGLPNYGRK